VIVVLASARDGMARALHERWAGIGARLMTPADLSVPGWQQCPGRSVRSRIVISNEPIPASEIAGVVTRLVAVDEHELQHIATEDRAYVAAEMNAFLLAWLSELPCRVVNPPTATCLGGPGWRRAQWAHLASRLGLRVVPLRTRTALTADATRAVRLSTSESIRNLTTITIAGERNVGDPGILVTQTRRLAAASGTDFLSATFTSPGPDAAFVGATPWPNLGSPGVEDALLALLRAPPNRSKAREGAA
jgi:hypothetical protein